MKITIDQISKRFLNHLIFKNVSLEFDSPGSYALLGANGSGKSTLLRIIAGMQSPTKGCVQYYKLNQIIPQEKIFQWISFCAPGMDLIDEMTLFEFLNFHFGFKVAYPNLNIPDIIDLIGLQKFRNTQIGNFSSGMKQRVKLAQAIFAQTPVLLLDEPCTNLDNAGIEQYQNWITQFSKDRLVIVASNDEREYNFCDTRISVEHYK